MKKIFTYPQNAATNYFDPNYYGDDNFGMRKRLLDIRGNTYLTQLNPANPTSASDESFLTAYGKLPLYLQEVSETGHIGAYDLWSNPLVEMNLGFRGGYGGWRLLNPAARDMIDDYGLYDAPRLEQMSGTHTLQDGDNVYLPGLGYPMGSPEWIDEGRANHAIVKVIDSTTVELYRNVDYNDDGTPDWENGDPVPYILWHLQTHQYDPKPTTYDSRPYVVHNQDPAKYDRFRARNDQVMSSFGSGFGADYVQNDKLMSAPFVTHPLTIERNGLTGTNYVDWSESLYGAFMSSNWSQHFSVAGDDDYKMPYWIPQGEANDGDDYTLYNMPSHVQQWGAGVQEVYDTAGPILPSWAVIREINHGLVDGDVVNITAAAGYARAFVRWHDPDSTDQVERDLPDSGVRNTYWVERVDVHHFMLHIVPYEVRDRADAELQATSNTVVRFERLPDGDATCWYWDRRSSTTVNFTGGGLDIRKAPVLYESGVGYHTWSYDEPWQTMNTYDESQPGNLLVNFIGTNNSVEDSDGAIGCSGREPVPMGIGPANWIHLGNRQYGYLDSNGDMVRDDAAEVNTNYMYKEKSDNNNPVNSVVGLGEYTITPRNGITTRTTDNSGTPSRSKVLVKPEFTIGTDSQGYLENAISIDNVGQLPWARGTSVTFRIQNLPDQYTSPAFTYTEDTWDTADYWTTYEADDDRYWPDHVRPTDAKITVVQPGSVNRSQSGIKYQRSLGVIRYQVELDYPPMTEEQFAPFLGAVQAARGQNRPFYLKLRYKNRSGEEIGLLFQDPADPDATIDTVRIRSLTDNNRVVEVDGLTPSVEKAIRSGQHFGGDSSNRNGRLNTIIQDQRSNVFGESKFRVAYPALGLSVGEKLDLNPSRAVVTLGDDQFEYSTDITGFYKMKVIFELDEFK